MTFTAARWSVRSLSTSVVEDPRSAPFHLCQPGIHPGGALPVEGLRMSQPHTTADFAHRSVMLNEVVELFASVPTGVVIDATLGGAGHTRAILEAHPHLFVLGLDQDDLAIATVSERSKDLITSGRLAIRKVRFDNLAAAAEDAFPGMPVVGVLFDLGVSSPQLDWAERGFSYRQDGPLDMRMDQTASLSASDVVNDYELDELTEILREGGEEKFARRVAKAIVAARPLTNTTALAETVRNAIPAAARRRPGDPAKRSFQAIRLEVNKELDVLSEALDAALEILSPSGRVVTLAYHSGEDRMIKQRFLEVSTGDVEPPPGFPTMFENKAPFRLVSRGSRKPKADEVLANPRAESARLRAVFALENKIVGEKS